MKISIIIINYYFLLYSYMSKIGILDPNAKYDNPLTKQPYKNIYDDPNKPKSEYVGKYTDFAKFWSNLPMYKQKTEEILKAFEENQVILITAGTGAGKTVLVPKYLLHVFNYDKKIACTNPKKIPSEENAKYAAIHLDVNLGEEVGIRYRGKKLDSDRTKLLYCTDGYLVATLKSDPLLSKFNGVIIDEAHERNNNIDLLLVLLKQLLLKRSDFKLVIMSATINTKLFIDYFPKKEFKFGYVHSEGTQLFPVKEYFIKDKVNKFDKRGNLENKLYIKAAIKVLNKVLQTTDEGGILIFMPSKADLRQGCLLLESDMRRKDVYCQPLSGSSNNLEKEYAISIDKFKTHPKGPFNRKVVIGTEVVESSITIKGLKYVIDCGLSNQSKYYARESQFALEKRYISKASHLQRKGRVGRKSSGVCYNVFTKKEYENLFPDYTISPILQSNIAQVVLSTLTGTYVNSVQLPFKYSNAKKFDPKIKTNLSTFFSLFIEKPKESYVNEALKRLVALGAIHKKDGRVTNLGYGMSKLNLEPEYARILIAGFNYGVLDKISELCAMLEIGEMNNFLLELNPRDSKDKNKKKQFSQLRDSWKSDSDHISMINIYQAYKSQEDKVAFCKKYHFHHKNFSKIADQAEEFKNQVEKLHKREQKFREGEYLYRKDIMFKDNSEKTKILAALSEGLFINLFKRHGFNYLTCFPKKEEMASIGKRSLINGKINTGIYTQFNSIFGFTVFDMVSKLPDKIINYIKKYKSKYFDRCLL